MFGLCKSVDAHSSQLERFVPWIAMVRALIFSGRVDRIDVGRANYRTI
jgi:hypothetical protein